jgi:hypothetical protein
MATHKERGAAHMAEINGLRKKVSARSTGGFRIYSLLPMKFRI